MDPLFGNVQSRKVETLFSGEITDRCECCRALLICPLKDPFQNSTVVPKAWPGKFSCTIFSGTSSHGKFGEILCHFLLPSSTNAQNSRPCCSRKMAASQTDRDAVFRSPLLLLPSFLRRHDAPIIRRASQLKGPHRREERQLGAPAAENNR